jgi:hypothetical protein
MQESSVGAVDSFVMADPHTPLRAASRPGLPVGEVLAHLFDAASAWIHAGEPALDCAVDPPEGTSTGARIARHALAIVHNGGSPVVALDDALVALLFAGEAAASRAPADGPCDPLGVQAAIEPYTTYERRLLDGVDRRPRALRNRARNLQLMITRRCQLRCSYCPVVKGHADMPRAVIDRAVDLLLTGDRPDLRLDFSGGEPLLRRDDVLRAARRMVEGASRRGQQASFYMVTNGFALDVPLASELAELGFRVELSLDGEEPVHNRCKTPVDPGENPYVRTRAALDAALQAGLDHTVVMVVTPETVSAMGRSLAHVLASGARSVDVNYAIGRAWAGPPLVRYLEGLDAIVAATAGRRARDEFTLGNLGTRVEPAVLNAEWMVDTDGSLHLMTEWAQESIRPSGAADLGRGPVEHVDRWHDLYAGRFHGYHALLRTYGWRDRTLRAVLHDNIRTGHAVARHLAAAGGSA